MKISGLMRKLGKSLILAGVVTAGTVAGGAAYTAAQAADREGDPFGQWTNLEEAELSRNSGGAAMTLGDIGLNIASNTATVSGNSVDGTVTTGQISDTALEDVSGINSLMFNTGNNVNFQSNMQINIFLK